MPLASDRPRTVAEQMVPLTLTAGRIHPHPGQALIAASELLLIVRGTISLELAQESADSEPVALPSLLAGDLWGEPAFVDAAGQPRKVVATAQGEVIAASLSREALGKLAEEAPATAARFMAVVCQSVSQMVRDGHRRVAEASQAMRDAQADG